MATAIDASVTVSVSSTMSKTTVPPLPAGATALGSTSRDAYTNPTGGTSAYTFGAGPNLAKGHFKGQWTCAAGAQVVFDMNAVLDDVFGDQIVATEVKAIYLHNLSTTTGDLLEVLGDAAIGPEIRFTLAAADAVNLHPDGMLVLTSPVDGFAVGAGANDTIEIDNNQAGGIAFEIWVLFEHV